MDKTIIIKIILSILLLVCLLDMPYGYYQLTRFLGLIGFGVLAFKNYQKNQTWFIIWISSAILINPFFKIALGRAFAKPFIDSFTLKQKAFVIK